MKLNRHVILTIGIVAGLVIGLVAGDILHRVLGTADQHAVASTCRFLGDVLFMNWLNMVLVPLVVASVVVGVASIDPASLGRIGGWTLLYYFSTMVAAVLLGVVLVTSIGPGRNFDQAFRQTQVTQYHAQTQQIQTSASQQGVSGEHGLAAAVWGAFRRIVTQMIPTNIVKSAADADVLPLIIFSLVFGAALSVLGEKARALRDLFDALFAAVMKLVEWILWLAPLGVLFLVMYTVVNIGVAALLGPLFEYMLTVLIGLTVHGLIVLPLVLWVFGRAHPYRYMHQMRQALMTAFGTDSSNATLPVTIESAETLGGVSKRAAGFVLPLGATINMDGTALYEAVAVMFLFQCYGIHLTAVQVAIIVITATLAAVGAAGIPSAGLVTMVIVVQAVNVSLGNTAPHLPLAAVGIIIGVDRILDMCRTVVNVWGDAVGAKIITRLAPDEAMSDV